MHQLRKIGYRASCDDLVGRDIADEAFDPGIRRDDMKEGLLNESFDIISFKRLVFSLFIEIAELGMRNDGGGIEFDLIRFEERISIYVFEGF